MFTVIAINHQPATIIHRSTIQLHIMPGDTLLDFPCDFPLKILGRHTGEFRSLALGIVQKHAGEVDASRIEERPSRDGNYLALTCTIRAESRMQLDALYRELTACEKVLVVL